MTLNELINMTKSFLKTFGYNPKNTGIDNAILFSRPTGMGVNDELLVYFHEKEQEDYIASRLKDLSDKYQNISGSDGRRFFLSTSAIGAIPELVTKLGFKFQVPVFFFDREFSAEKKASPLKQIKEKTKEYEAERIEQPYKSGGAIKDKDLLIDILEEIEEASNPCLRIILAPAGYGKSVLMETLYSRMEKKFLEDKQARITSKRPLLMLPGHIKQASDLDSLIGNFIGDEYDYGAINKETFKLMVNNNLAVWLLDGLEELILKIPEEFIFSLLEDFISSGNGKNPQIVIAIRKPVLSTLPELKEYIQDCGDWIKVYELSAWGDKQKIAYFDRNLELSRNEKDNFKRDLLRPSSLNQICSVPYYCNLICDLENNGEMQVFNDECDLVKYATEKICEREFGKGIERDILTVERQMDIFSVLAEESFMEGKITQATLKEYSELVLSEFNLQKDIEIKQMECMQRHALLTQVGEDYDIMHDIIKHYLLGINLTRYLKNIDFRVFDKKEIEPDSFIMRCLVKNASKLSLEWEKIHFELLSFKSLPNDSANAFRNLLRTLLCLDSSKANGILSDLVGNRNLTGLRFKNMDLSNFNFQLSKLELVSFENCNLKNTNFNNSFLKDTFFDSRSNLSGATFKGAILESISDDKKNRNSINEIQEFLFARTRIRPDRTEPCQAVVNLKRVLEKLVRKGRGYRIPKKFLIQVKCGGGITAEACLYASIKQGILLEEGEYIKIKNNLFDRISKFAIRPNSESLDVSLSKILDDICIDLKKGCRHIYSE